MKLGFAALVVALGAALDLATKAWARGSLEAYGEAREFLPFVALRLTFNEGVSFSMLAFDGDGQRLALSVALGAITLALAFWAYRSNGWQRAALAVALAGAVGNLIDRGMNAAVTDFLDLHFGTRTLFVFNLADVWISLGVVLLMLLPVFEARNKIGTA